MGEQAAQFPELRSIWLGTVEYSEALALQRTLFDRRKAGTAPDTLLLLEHSPVYTMGRRADRADILADDVTLADIGVTVADTDRGGEVTYHGPGQLVMYPVISIREAELGPVTYVRILEQVVIDTLRYYGVKGHRVVGKTGVWVGGEPGAKPLKGQNPAGRKIAAMGVRVSGGVAMHGLALNVTTDLTRFDMIVPCGMPGLPVTSVRLETGVSPPVREVSEFAASRLGELLQRRIVQIARSELAA